MAGLKTGDEGSRDDQNEIVQNRGERNLSRKRKIGLATYDRENKRRIGRNQVTQNDTRCIQVDVALKASAGLQSGGAPTTPKAITETCVTTPSDAASVVSSVVQAGPWKPELMPHNSQPTHSKGPQERRKKKIRNIQQICPPSSTPNPSPTFL